MFIFSTGALPFKDGRVARRYGVFFLVGLVRVAPDRVKQCFFRVWSLPCFRLSPFNGAGFVAGGDATVAFVVGMFFDFGANGCALCNVMDGAPLLWFVARFYPTVFYDETVNDCAI